VGTVVNFDQQKQVKEQRIATQEIESPGGADACSVEFRRLAELRGYRYRTAGSWSASGLR
jgi:hypothetical protein